MPESKTVVLELNPASFKAFMDAVERRQAYQSDLYVAPGNNEPAAFVLEAIGFLENYRALDAASNPPETPGTPMPDAGDDTD